MSATFTLDSVPLEARADALADAFRGYRMALNLRLHSYSPRMSASFSSVSSGALTVETFATKGVTGRVERHVTSRHEDAPTTTTFHLLAGGDVDIHQSGRQARPATGQLVISSSELPFATDQRDSCLQHTFTVDNAALGISSNRLSPLLARAIATDALLVSVVSAHLRHLASQVHDNESAEWSQLERPTIDMMRALVLTQVGREREAQASLALSLTDRVLSFMRLNLGDDELTATVIARQHGISTRYLYMLLAVRGISVADWIRTARIEASLHLLASDSISIAEIAFRVGFPNQSRFARTFRAVMGMSPTDWRAERRPR
ncbi:hypothetical protein BH11ACT3_BH11ACT3_18770 [soil metagenome]